MKKVLTIAGSDCSGGAGIQADIKTITAHKMYSMSAITALTAQNTTGVYGILESTADFVGKQLDCIFQDIRPDAVKIGMVSNIEIIEVIAQKLGQYEAANIVVDPVMVSTSGGKLLSDNAIGALKSHLFSIATVITPNIPEAEVLTGFSIKSKEDMQKAAEEITKVTSGSVLVKGGHLEDCADDLLYTKGNTYWFEAPKIENPNTHGTGCTLSSAIACNLASGLDIVESIKNAKEYITGALKANLKLGKGRGPLNHCFNL
ncbi:MAG: bifunctional hydroxymethylpyrimidine kinase/phosphomethylpyrimidine kinase [Thermoanaerobacteraceae bacterium]|nr:bifunctional hydroxymethylpyrimidine kinase/phosphomethylpyrimidine kinase [Thermoanaerobacteraceae bacterium]